MREDSKEEREAEPGLLELKASGVLESIVNNWKVYQKHPKMLLALTWGHCTPADTPTSTCTIATRTEHQVDDVACASYVSRQGPAASFLHYVSIIWINRWSKWSKDRNDRNLKIINFKARWKHNYFGGSDNITMWYLIWIKIFKTSAKNSCL